MTLIQQEEPTGCGIASTAVLAGVTYQEAKKKANKLGIYADDKALWSETDYIRRLLLQFHIKADRKETTFNNWNDLPNLALLAINWHLEEGKPYWHWVVFVRESDNEYILDSSLKLENPMRTDLSNIQPKWYITIY